MVGGHKKVISYFVGTAWLRSRRFLFQQFFHGDKAHKVIGNADALMPLAAGLVRGFNVDRLDKFPQRIGGKLVQVLIFAHPLDKLLQIFNLSFLYFDFLLQSLDFLFKLCLFVLIGLAHHRELFICDAPRHIILVNADKQTVKFYQPLFSLC